MGDVRLEPDDPLFPPIAVKVFFARILKQQIAVRRTARNKKI